MNIKENDIFNYMFTLKNPRSWMKIKENKILLHVPTIKSKFKYEY